MESSGGDDQGSGWMQVKKVYFYTIISYKDRRMNIFRFLQRKCIYIWIIVGVSYIMRSNLFSFFG